MKKTLIYKAKITMGYEWEIVESDLPPCCQCGKQKLREANLIDPGGRRSAQAYTVSCSECGHIRKHRWVNCGIYVIEDKQCHHLGNELKTHQ